MNENSTWRLRTLGGTDLTVARVCLVLWERQGAVNVLSPHSWYHWGTTGADISLRVIRVLGKVLVPLGRQGDFWEQRGGLSPSLLPLISLSESFSPFRAQLTFHLLQAAHREQLSSPYILPPIAVNPSCLCLSLMPLVPCCLALPCSCFIWVCFLSKINPQGERQESCSSSLLSHSHHQTQAHNEQKERFGRG